ncbi:hypothetical protein L6164_012093 [Bauhinia variegata]|uniref:Uncharacterized protein n=1 Tax=Bauhinia variegata TaxID=167791 RepID=A0ACB9PA65_BAUVA|nr:hypothetical protein L6164_012093 [Bauhinia variegata]
MLVVSQSTILVAKYMTLSAIIVIFTNVEKGPVQNLLWKFNRDYETFENFRNSYERMLSPSPYGPATVSTWE